MGLIKRFEVKKGDKVIVRTNKNHEEVYTVKGFRYYGMITGNGHRVPFYTARFYGTGYVEGERFITIKKRWHYYPAVIFEIIRLALPQKIGDWVFLQDYKRRGKTWD